MVETFSDKILNWFEGLRYGQRAWIVLSTLAVFTLGLLSGDTAINVLIGTVGMFYVSVYSTGARGSFLLGVLYVSLYTFVCLQNKIMLDALQNIILIPIYIASYIHWGKNSVKPSNPSKTVIINTIVSFFIVLGGLYFLSQVLHGNYSMLDALNTTCTLYAMVLGYFGFSINWALWSINNVASAVVFGLALATPTGSITVFAMKMIFVLNGLFGWYNFYKIGKEDK